MLSLSAVSASYGSVPAVAGISIEVGEGEAVGLLGANGAGKSTTLRAISGLVRLTSGTISFLGTDTASLPPYKITELGIAHVPEGRQVFPEMTVQENLEIGAYVPKAKAERSRTLELVFNIFPVLAERRKQFAGTMSGGEQQMLAVGRGLMLSNQPGQDRQSFGGVYCAQPLITATDRHDYARRPEFRPHPQGNARHSADADHGRGRHRLRLFPHRGNRAGRRRGGLSAPCGAGRRALGHRVGTDCCDLRGAGIGVLFLSAALHLPNRGPA